MTLLAWMKELNVSAAQVHDGREGRGNAELAQHEELGGESPDLVPVGKPRVFDGAARLDVGRDVMLVAAPVRHEHAQKCCVAKLMYGVFGVLGDLALERATVQAHASHARAPGLLYGLDRFRESFGHVDVCLRQD